MSELQEVKEKRSQASAYLDVDMFEKKLII